MEAVQSLVLILSLGYNSLLDIKKREISVWGIAMCVCCGLLYRVLSQIRLLDTDAVWNSIRQIFFTEGRDLVMALLPGIVCLLVAWATREAIGYGDGLLLLGCGCILREDVMLLVCMTAWLLACAGGLMLWIVFHKDKSYPIPFAPFLLCSYILVRSLS